MIILNAQIDLACVLVQLKASIRLSQFSSSLDTDDPFLICIEMELGDVPWLGEVLISFICRGDMFSTNGMNSKHQI